MNSGISALSVVGWCAVPPIMGGNSVESEWSPSFVARSVIRFWFRMVALFFGTVRYGNRCGRVYTEPPDWRACEFRPMVCAT